jgi:hypothetical protein
MGLVYFLCVQAESRIAVPAAQLCLFRGLRRGGSSAIHVLGVDRAFTHAQLWFGCSVDLSNLRPSFSGYFQLATERAVQLRVAEGKTVGAAWESVPYRLAFFDYLGNNPSKGGLFRNGP